MRTRVLAATRLAREVAAWKKRFTQAKDRLRYASKKFDQLTDEAAKAVWFEEIQHRKAVATNCHAALVQSRRQLELHTLHEQREVKHVRSRFS
jgi:hypothetical protein